MARYAAGRNHSRVSFETSPSQQLSKHDNENSLYSRHSYDGLCFDYRETFWSLKKGVCLDLTQLKVNLSESLLEGCLKTLAFYAENYSAGTVRTYLSIIIGFILRISHGVEISELSTTVVANYRSAMLSKFGHDRDAISLRPYLLKWHELGYPGVSIEVVNLLKSWTLKKPPVGEAVKRLDPSDGPLDPIELVGLKNSIMGAYEKRCITHQQLTISLLCIYTGRRPCQICALKLEDLAKLERREKAGYGIFEQKRDSFLIHIPRAKQAGAKFRELRKPVAVTPELWAIAMRQKEDVLTKCSELFTSIGWDIKTQDMKDVTANFPLFPSWRLIVGFLKRAKASIELGCHADVYASLRIKVSSDEWHLPAEAIHRIVKKTTQLSGARDRTGGSLHLTPRRLRYTKGTDAARAGYGSVVIAELLDHSNTACVDIYTKISAEHAGPINRAMAVVMAPLVELFRGEVVAHEQDAVGGTKPAESRIIFKGTGTATCGEKAKCGLSRLPRPCYTCSHFQPWIDGPHEAVLDMLLREREERRLVLQDDVMVGIDDHTIIAVINVIQLCEKKRKV